MPVENAVEQKRWDIDTKNSLSMNFMVIFLALLLFLMVDLQCGPMQADAPQSYELEKDISNGIGYVKSIREKINGAQNSVEKILSEDVVDDPKVQKHFFESSRCLFEALRMVHVQHGIFRTMQALKTIYSLIITTI